MSSLRIAAGFSLIIVTIWAMPAPLSAQCNPCHTCPVDPDKRYIGGAGASTQNQESPPNGTCMRECSMFGEDCGALASLEEFAKPLFRGESPSVLSLVDEQSERLRYIPERRMIVVLANDSCGGGWLLAFPVREDEVGFVRESVAVLE